MRGWKVGLVVPYSAGESAREEQRKQEWKGKTRRKGSVTDLAEFSSCLRIRGGYRSNSKSSFQNNELNQNVT